MLELAKKLTSDFTFDDGVVLSLKESKPSHVQFFCKTSKALDAESCNLRLFQMMPAKELEVESQQQEELEGLVEGDLGRRLFTRKLLETETASMTCKEELLFKESAR